jgi:MFS family permease
MSDTLLSALRVWAANFSPLRRRPVRIYLSGQAVSLFGNFLQQTALGLLVYRLSGGAAAPLGVLSACSALPLLLLSPFSGALADRWPRRRLLLACHGFQMAAAFLLAVLSATDTVQLWQVYVVSAGLGAVQAVYFPSQQGFFFDLAGRAEIRRLIAINSMVLNISRTGGPALAGYLVAHQGVATAFFYNGLSFVAVVLSLIAIGRLPAAAHHDAPAQGLRGTLHWIARSPQLRSLYACSTLLHTGGLGMLALTPALTGGDARATGLVLGAAGAGSLVYAFVLSPFLNHLPRMGLALSLTLSWMGAWLMVAALSTTLELRMAAFFMFGLSTSMAMVGCTGTMQYVAPSALRGRLMGLNGVVGFGSQPVAALVIGLLADHIGARHAVALAGAMALLLALSLLVQPGWRRWIPQPPPEPAPGGLAAAPG